MNTPKWENWKKQLEIVMNGSLANAASSLDAFRDELDEQSLTMLAQNISISQSVVSLLVSGFKKAESDGKRSLLNCIQILAKNHIIRQQFLAEIGCFEELARICLEQHAISVEVFQMFLELFEAFSDCWISGDPSVVDSEIHSNSLIKILSDNILQNSDEFERDPGVLIVSFSTLTVLLTQPPNASNLKNSLIENERFESIARQLQKYIQDSNFDVASYAFCLLGAIGIDRFLKPDNMLDMITLAIDVVSQSRISSIVIQTAGILKQIVDISTIMLPNFSDRLINGLTVLIGPDNSVELCTSALRSLIILDKVTADFQLSLSVKLVEEPLLSSVVLRLGDLENTDCACATAGLLQRLFGLNDHILERKLVTHEAFISLVTRAYDYILNHLLREGSTVICDDGDVCVHSVNSSCGALIQSCSDVLSSDFHLSNERDQTVLLFALVPYLKITNYSEFDILNVVRLMSSVFSGNLIQSTLKNTTFPKNLLDFLPPSGESRIGCSAVCGGLLCVDALLKRVSDSSGKSNIVSILCTTLTRESNHGHALGLFTAQNQGIGNTEKSEGNRNTDTSKHFESGSYIKTPHAMEDWKQNSGVRREQEINELSLHELSNTLNQSNVGAFNPIQSTVPVVVSGGTNGELALLKSQNDQYKEILDARSLALQQADRLVEANRSRRRQAEALLIEYQKSLEEVQELLVREKEINQENAINHARTGEQYTIALNTIQQYETQIGEQEIRLDEQFSKLANMTETQIALGGQNSTLTNECEELQSENMSLKTALEKTNSSLGDSQSAVMKAQEHIDFLQKINEDYEDTINGQAREIQELRTRCEANALQAEEMDRIKIELVSLTDQYRTVETSLQQRDDAVKRAATALSMIHRMSATNDLGLDTSTLMEENSASPIPTTTVPSNQFLSNSTTKRPWK